MNDLTYEKNGHNEKTSKFLRNRGTCCKTSCLHCPYGFTLKKEGIEFIPVSDSNFSQALEIAPDTSSHSATVASNLLASAFGDVKPKISLTAENKGDFFLLSLKGEFCGLIKKSKTQATDLFHKEHFEDQGITLDYINSIFPL